MKKVFSLLSLLFLFYSCTDPKKDYLDEFSEFINEVELSQDSYDDDEWVIIEAEFNKFSKIDFIDFKNDLSQPELNQIRSYRERFKTVRIKRDPAGSLLEILGL